MTTSPTLGPAVIPDDRPRPDRQQRRVFILHGGVLPWAPSETEPDLARKVNPKHGQSTFPRLSDDLPCATRTARRRTIPDRDKPETAIKDTPPNLHIGQITRRLITGVDTRRNHLDPRLVGLAQQCLKDFPLRRWEDRQMGRQIKGKKTLKPIAERQSTLRGKQISTIREAAYQPAFRAVILNRVSIDQRNQGTLDHGAKVNSGHPMQAMGPMPGHPDPQDRRPLQPRPNLPPHPKVLPNASTAAKHADRLQFKGPISGSVPEDRSAP